MNAVVSHTEDLYRVYLDQVHHKYCEVCRYDCEFFSDHHDPCYRAIWDGLALEELLSHRWINFDEYLKLGNYLDVFH